MAAIDDDGLAAVLAAGGIAVGGADQQIVEAVAVDISGRRDRVAGALALRQSMDFETLVRGELAEVDVRREAAFLAEDDIGAALVAGIGRADQDIGIAVAVEIAGQGDRETGHVAGID